MQVKANYWIEQDGKVALSRWRVALLLAIDETGSISAAAERMKIPYRRAWDKIHECEERLGVKLLETQTGGVGGGGARLSPAGSDYVRRFQQFSQGLDSLVEEHFARAFGDVTDAGSRPGG
jgi:molybdate transport system regulatory protein